MFTKPLYGYIGLRRNLSDEFKKLYISNNTFADFQDDMVNFLLKESFLKHFGSHFTKITLE